MSKSGRHFVNRHSLNRRVIHISNRVLQIWISFWLFEFYRGQAALNCTIILWRHMRSWYTEENPNSDMYLTHSAANKTSKHFFNGFAVRIRIVTCKLVPLIDCYLQSLIPNVQNIQWHLQVKNLTSFGQCRGFCNGKVETVSSTWEGAHNDCICRGDQPILWDARTDPKIWSEVLGCETRSRPPM